MKGGDRQRIWRAAGRDTDFAHLLIEKIWESDAKGSAQFRADYRRLLKEWRRWLVVMDRWWQKNHGGMPYHHFQANQQFFDTLDCRFTFYPKPRPLNAAQRIAYTQRSRIVEAATGPIFTALPAERIRAGDPAFEWGQRMLESTTRLVRDLYDEVNPGEKKRNPRGLHHAFRFDVQQFCERWSLRAWWAVPLFIHLLFLSAEMKTDEPLHLNLRGPYTVLSWRLYAPLPGFTDEAVERSIRDLDDLVLLWPDQPDRDFRVVHEPDRDEMRLIERERDAACVVLDWNGDGFGGHATALRWAETEIAERLGRSLTKREARAVSRYLDPQVREARKWFMDSGQFEVEAHAFVETYAKWCATMVLDPKRTYLHFVRDGENADNVRMRCNEFAARASLQWPPSRRLPASSSAV